MIDYMIMEAVLIKTRKEDQKLQEEAELAATKKKWQTDRDDLKKQL